MGLQGKGEFQSRVERKASERISPFLCTSNVEDFAWMDWGPARSFGNPESEDVTTNVEMVADEIFCWLHRIAASREASRYYESRKPTLDVFRKILEQRDVLCSRTNTQMMSGVTKAQL